jgi:hypothetical protein
MRSNDKDFLEPPCLRVGDESPILRYGDRKDESVVKGIESGVDRWVGDEGEKKGIILASRTSKRRRGRTK